MKRFLAATLASLLLCTTLASAVENPFSDVVTDSDLAQAVMWALEEGVTTGYADGTFQPDATCTRGQVVTFLWRAKGEPTPAITENPFTDVESSSPYYTAILWAVGKSITTGTGDGTTFSPSTNCTSGQVVTFLFRAMGEPESTYESAYADGAASAYVNAINWADETGLLDGMDFSVSAASPRSDIVTYLYRDAGSPAMEVTDPEPVVYTYTAPEYTVPSSELELSWEYFADVFSYLALSGDDSFTITCTGYTFDSLNANTNWTELRNQGFDYALAQHIDILKLYYSWTYSHTTSSNVQIILTLTYDSAIYSSLSAVEADRDVFFAKVSDLVTGFYDSGALKETDSDMVVARYLYNWVCDNTFYGDNTANPYSGYTTLTTGQGVCMGYAGLINALYRTAGIECYGVGCSSLANGEGHTINTANLDGTWYYIDATFGDTGNNYDKYFAMTRSTVDGIYALDYKWA
ncbi:S-layer homology domain-containing protein [Bengtsoniella intestinalis]|uniref:S-layer homology domain-containing protein n=1 Tax=Bengtsoniella intestinalis TaxID=3073143 RepID=UPI00391F4541